MAYEYALYEKDGHIATITMNRPAVLNAIHPPATVELSAIWDDALADDDVWVIVLTGAGDKAFSAIRMWSNARVKNAANVDTNGILPQAAKPTAVPTMFCSAM